MIDLYKTNGQLKARAKLLYDFREVKVAEAKELWLEEQRVTYEEAYPSFEMIVDEEGVEARVELEQDISFDEYLAETVVVTPYTEAELDADGIVIVKEVQEVTEFVREFVAPDITEAEFDVYMKPILLPKVVTMRQARLALLDAGLLSTVESAITGGQDEALKIEWEYATEVRRDWQSLEDLVNSMGMPDDALDDLFILAGSL